MKEYGREVVDLNADVEEVLEREELLRIEQERDEREALVALYFFLLLLLSISFQYH